MFSGLSGFDTGVYLINYTRVMNKRIVSLLIFVLAVSFYLVGMALAATIFLAMGVITELGFWVRLFRTD